MAINMKTQASTIALSMGLALVTAQQSLATEGYFQHGWGARHSALAGAGVADGRDATGASLNPASLLKAGDQIQVGLTLFSPHRKVTGLGGSGFPGLAPLGETVSDTNAFLVPNIAYSKQIDENSAWGITMYGNGGMNTDYPAVARAVAECGGGSGVFCGGSAGVNMMQGFIAPTYAYDFGKVSVGISPLIAMQMFEAKGLVAFSAASSDPANLTGPGLDTSFGFGVKVGFEVELSENMRLGGSYQPKIDMAKFEGYAGLFEGQGDFDVPQNFQIGIAVDGGDNNNITFMADYKRIYYSDVPSVGNSMAPVLAPPPATIPFGATGGPGFGWQDVDVYKVGIEHRVSDEFTYRLGYAHNTASIIPSEVTLNILAPATVQDHITGGFSYKVSDKSTFEVAGMYAPNVQIEGNEPPGFGNPGNVNRIEMYQYAITVSWSYKLGD